MSFRYQHGDRPLEGYTIQRGVGRGGFGEVYYAISDGGREVALKSILFNEEIELRGVRHCINLKNPQLVSIFDVRHGEDGTPFVIMEYVTGPSLRDLLRENPQGLGAQKTGFLVREIAKGLAYLHERGIVHRDLKPENIFYEEGYVKIGDYGLSKFINASHQSGQTMSVGTVHYMAPEIGSGNYHRGIDIYALGIILYELLTGDVPYTGDSFGEVLMKHLTAKPDLKGIEEPFRSTIKGALEKKPEDRTQSVDELARRLFADEALNTSVTGFNPASLSQVAQKAHRDGPAPGSAATGTLSDPAPRAEARQKPAIEDAAIADDGLSGYAASKNRPQSSSKDERQSGAGSKRPQPFNPHPFTAQPLDPLNTAQRLARVLFVGGLSVIGLAILGLSGEDLLGFMVATLGCAGAVALTEYHLNRIFQISHGFGWRVVTTAVAAIPVAIGSEPVRHEGETMGAILISMLIITWRERSRPIRRERLSFAGAVTAGLCGLFFGGWFGGEPIFVGGVMATTSLLVGAFMPYIPREVRERLRRSTGGASAPPPAPVEPLSSRARKVWSTYAERRDRNTEPDPVQDPVHYDRSVPTGLDARPESPRSRQGVSVAPGILAKFFWVFVACAMLAGAISVFIGCFVMRMRGDDRLGLLAFGLCLVGYSGFSFYRGLWARRPSFWGRTLRPFLLFTFFNGGVVSACCFVLGTSLGVWRFGQEETVVSLVCLMASTFAFGFLLVVDDALSRLRGPPSYHLPPHQRSVAPIFRFIYLLVAAASTLGGVATLSIALLLPHRDSWDRFGFLCGSIVLLALGVFTLRQGIRRRRGHLWSGSVRPFILSAMAAVMAVCCLPLFIALRGLGDEETMVFVVFGTFAAVFGVAVFYLRGPDEVHENPLWERLVDFTRARHQKTSSSWSGMGTILWIFGIGLGLATLTVVSGLASLSGLEHELDREFVLFLVERGPWVAALLVLAGGFCVSMGRAASGALHLGRGLIGQVVLLVCVAVIFVPLASIHILPEGNFVSSVHRDQMMVSLLGGLLTGILGAFLMAWPAARELEVKSSGVAEAAAEERPKAEEVTREKKPVLGGKEA